MAGRGRDLEVGILSNVDAFDLSGPARELEDLADGAKDTGKALDNLGDGARSVDDVRDELRRLAQQGDDARRELQKLNREAADNALDEFGQDAKDTAKKVDSAFDSISKSSRSNLHQKLDDDTDHAKHSLKEVGEEAQDTGREMAASFSGSSDDILGAIQELAANAGVAFGPLGAGLSVALGAGLGTFFANWQKKKEQLTQDVQDFTAALVEGQGKLSEEFLNQRIAEIDPKKLKDLAQAATDAQLPVREVIRAYAGDPQAIDAVNKKLDEAQRKLAATGVTSAEADTNLTAYGNAAGKVRDELGLTNKALGQSKTAYELMRDAMEKPTVPTVDGSKAIDQADNTRRHVEDSLRRKVKIPVGIDGASVSRELQIAWLNADRYARTHPIVLRTTGPTGQRPVRDVP